MKTSAFIGGLPGGIWSVHLPVLRQRRGRLQADFAGLGADPDIAIAGLLDHRPGHDHGPREAP